MSVLQTVATALEPWKTFWADHDAVSNIVTATHVASIVVGGGLAIAADRMTLRVRRRAEPDRSMHLAELHDVHRPVLTALALVVTSGLLMLASDIEEFVVQPLYWIKMGLIVVLLVNGLLLQKAERTPDASWSRMSLHARASMLLWVMITVAGVAL